MPWTAADAERHTRKADTPARRMLWAAVANRSLETAIDHGLHDPEAHAIRIANGAVDRAPRRFQAKA